MPDDEKEIKVRATWEGAEVKAGAEELKADIAGIAPAADEVSTAANHARETMAQFVSDVSNTGKVSSESFDHATTAVDGLDAAIKRAASSEGPIPKGAKDLLEGYRATLADAAPAVTRLAEATTPAAAAAREHGSAVLGLTDATRPAITATTAHGSAHAYSRAQMDVAREAMGPLSRAVEALTNSQNAIIASLSKWGLAAGAVAGAAVVLGKGLEDLRSRGVDVTTFTDIASGLMDRLAVALGGTTKAAMEAEQAFTKEQEKLIDLDEATRNFPSSMALLVAANIDATAAFAELAKGETETRIASEAMTAQISVVPERVDQARKRFDELNAAINLTRVTNPELAKSLQETAIALAKEAAAGVDVTERFHDLSDKAMAGKKATEDLAKVLGDLIPTSKKVSAEFGTFSEAAQHAVTRMAEMRASGISQTNAFNDMKGEINQVAVGYQKFGDTLKITDPLLAAQIQQLFKLALAHAGSVDAIEKHNKLLVIEREELTRLRVEMDKYPIGSAQRVLAMKSVEDELDKLIAKLDKQRDSEGKLNVGEQALYDQAVRMRGEIEKLGIARDKEDKSYDNLAKKIFDEVKKLDDLTTAYEKNKLKITEHADQAIADTERERVKITGELDGQIAALEAAHRRGDISNADYFAHVNALQLAEVEARRAAEEKERLIQIDAENNLGALKSKYDESSNAIVAAMKREGLSLTQSFEIHDEYQKKVKLTVEQIEQEVIKHNAAVVAIGSHKTEIAELGKGLTKEATAGGGLVKFRDGVVQIHTAFDEKLHPSIDMTGRKVGEMEGAFTKAAPVIVASLNPVEVAVDRLTGKITLLNQALAGIDVGAGGTAGSEGG